MRQVNPDRVMFLAHFQPRCNPNRLRAFVIGIRSVDRLRRVSQPFHPALTLQLAATNKPSCLRVFVVVSAVVLISLR